MKESDLKGDVGLHLHVRNTVERKEDLSVLGGCQISKRNTEN